MNFWNERYQEPGKAYGMEPNEFVRTHAQALRRGNILSLCEGEGRNAVFLAQLGHTVAAVDGSEVGLKNKAVTKSPTATIAAISARADL